MLCDSLFDRQTGTTGIRSETETVFGLRKGGVRDRRSGCVRVQRQKPFVRRLFVQRPACRRDRAKAVGGTLQRHLASDLSENENDNHNCRGL